MEAKKKKNVQRKITEDLKKKIIVRIFISITIYESKELLAFDGYISPHCFELVQVLPNFNYHLVIFGFISFI